MMMTSRRGKATGGLTVKVPAKVGHICEASIIFSMPTYLGLFLGLLCLVGGIIIIIIFFVMKDSEEFRGEMFWIYYGAEIVILTFAIVASVGAFVQIQKLSHSYNKPYKLDNLLSSITVFGSYVYAIFGVLSSLVSILNPQGDLNIQSVLVFVQCALLLVQVSSQSKAHYYHI